MSNIQISKRNFELSKNRIQTLSNNVPQLEQLPTLETEGGMFNWFDKKVTGAEMNQITGIINRSFIKSNKEIIKLYNQFKEAYNTFESLDKEYIQGIITAVDGSVEASEQAKEASQQAIEASRQAIEASEEAEEASNQALAAQKDINRVIEALKISVSKLEKTKEEFSILKNNFEKIEKYFEINSNEIAELRDIDEIEKKINKHEEHISLLSAKIANIEKKKQNVTYWVAGAIILLALFRFILLMVK